MGLLLLPRFDVKQYIRAIERYRLTMLTGVPTMYALMLQQEALRYVAPVLILMGHDPVWLAMLIAIVVTLLDRRIVSFEWIIGGMIVHTDQMMRNLEMTRGLVFSPRVMLALVEAGMDRKNAYDLVQSYGQDARITGLLARNPPLVWVAGLGFASAGLLTAVAAVNGGWLFGRMQAGGHQAGIHRRDRDAVAHRAAHRALRDLNHSGHRSRAAPRR